jgi:hypothetical protein
VDRASSTFRTIRNDLGIGGEHPPSLYEIRSLSLWLYRQQFDERIAQSIAAHSDEKMQKIYMARRDDEEVIYVDAGLKI